MSLPIKYRPQSLSQVHGQPLAVALLSSFVANPSSQAFVFSGPTGVGKTCAAHALALDLGCCSEFPELGGIYEVPSGKQDGAAVEGLLRSLSLRPMMGSGWKVAIVNEADYMTRQAEVIWLDALEALPSRTVIILTTNDVCKLTSRLMGRCELIRFSGDPADVEAPLHDLLRHVWYAETGKLIPHIPEGIGRYDLFSGTLSFRLALQQISPYLRAGLALPAKFEVPMMRDERDGPGAGPVPDYSTAARKAAATRKRNKGG